jgi:hypothetical protein
MKDKERISIEEYPEEWIVTLEETGHGAKPTGAILNYSGEVIARLELCLGANRVALQSYKAKNYFIRVTNGKNVVTRKI